MIIYPLHIAKGAEEPEDKRLWWMQSDHSTGNLRLNWYGSDGWETISGDTVSDAPLDNYQYTRGQGRWNRFNLSNFLTPAQVLAINSGITSELIDNARMAFEEEVTTRRDADIILDDKIQENKLYIDQQISTLESTALTFKGFISTTQPTVDVREGNLWFNSTTQDTNFPWQVSTYTSGSWSVNTTDYTPVAMDLWSRLSDNAGFYYFGESWNQLDFAGSVFNNVQFSVINGVINIANGCITDTEVATNANIAQSKVSGLITDISNKQTLLTPANAGQNIVIDTTNPTVPKISVMNGGDSTLIDKRMFINIIRGTVGRNAHLVPALTDANSYAIFSDGMIRPGINSLFTTNGTIQVGNKVYPASELRGVRHGIEAQVNSPNYLANILYEHFSVSLLLNSNCNVGTNFLTDGNLEYLHIGTTGQYGFTGNSRAFSNLPNLNTVIVPNANVFTNLGNAFNNIQNNSNCLLYIQSMQQGDLIKAKFPGFSNWTVKEMNPFQ